MKMVKSLLLGSAAGLLAVSGAQAADLPVKAKPVEYVKICSLYGAGYYYMPGTDICLKLGGFVRYQYTGGSRFSSVSFGPFFAPGGLNTRDDSSDGQHRARSVLTIDTRQQTAYGTLRTYFLIGYTHDSGVVGEVGSGGGNSSAAGLYATRGFIQIAGFTFGKATSFFDIMPGASYAYNAGLYYHPDTGDGGRIVAAYTAQFGNGFSATIALEDANAKNSYVWGTSVTAFGALAPSSNRNVHWNADIVGNIRVDQAWGSALVGFALHDASGGYYGPTNAFGGPGNEWGWAVTGGFNLNLPMIAPGDRFSFGAVYSEGAIRYAANNAPNGGFYYFDGTTVGWGFMTDAVYGTSTGAPAGAGTAVHLTTAWSMSAAFEHLWTPALRTSIYGSYIDVSYSPTANALICAEIGAGTFLAPTCNADFSAWNLGSRTQWEPVRGLVLGVDVTYSKLNSMTTNAGTLTLPAAVGSRPAGAYTIADQDAWTGTFRIQRSYLP